jgi:hypothetical protein
MRTFMFATLVMTFLSGATSGYLVGNTTAEAPAPLTWIDRDLQALEKMAPEISAKDLADARLIYEDHDRRVINMKSEAESLLGDQLRWLQNHTKQKIDTIIDSYASAKSDSK